MFAAEPPQSAYDLKFRLLDIPVRVHPLFWLVTLLLGLNRNTKAPDMALWIGVCFVSILIHELGHALAARRQGWEPWITLYSFGGLASYQPTYHDPRKQIMIAFAGPGAGFLFAGVILLLIAATGHHPHFDPTFSSFVPFDWQPYDAPRLEQLIWQLLVVNIFWGLINLLPVFPLDGGQISREVLSLVNPQDSLRISLWTSVIVAATVAVLAFVKLHDNFLAIFFAYLAYTSYQALQQYFGTGGGRGNYR